MATEIKFEKALEKLEEIVNDLEAGDVTLEEALKKYEEGIKLSRSCQTKLAQAEKRIELLMKHPDGSFSKKEFDSEAYEESPENKPAKKSRVSKKPISDEGDLLI